MTTYANNFISLKPNNDFIPDPVQCPSVVAIKLLQTNKVLVVGKQQRGRYLPGELGVSGNDWKWESSYYLFIVWSYL